jgi:alkanesulfonate monooxygenase SsuD/methylene tetrahydromethanopterin reductase-like flavin-dependent oxidoreductase (luciferase family)
MRFAVDVAPLGESADPRVVARFARTAEAAGWDGLSTWDVLATTMGGAADPFVALAAAAAATERISLIASVVALPRRRPQLVTQAAASLDLLSGGRLTLGIGAGGDPADFEAFGEPSGSAARIAALDEASILVDAWLRGGSVRHEGDVFVARDVPVGPTPARRPRPPIWFGGSGRPGALRRAAAWDGWIAVAVGDDGVSLSLAPDDLAEAVGRLRAERVALGRDTAAFDIAVFGQDGLGGYRASEFAAAGATWWLESFSPMRGTADELLAIVAKGPPGG